MELKKLSIHNFRNLSSVSIKPSTGFNIFWGKNGAGKTSILEAIYTLSHGRSFRGSTSRDLIQYEKGSFVVHGEILETGSTHSIGIERDKSSFKARLDRENVKSISILSERLPVLIIHPGSFNLLTGDPSSRRAFLDWGLFFSSPDFKHHWNQYRQALRQRNASIKSHSTDAQIKCWDSILIESGQIISESREQYLETLGLSLPKLENSFGGQSDIQLYYKSGWSRDRALRDELDQNLERDRRLGFTFSGPHRGDFTTHYQQKDAAKFASRGQIKLVTLLLKLAQGSVYIQNSKKSCLLLLDDLSSELDRERLETVTKIVSSFKTQTFITSVEKKEKLYAPVSNLNMFHVKRGKIT